MCLYSHIITISKLIALVDRIFYGFLFPSWNRPLSFQSFSVDAESELVMVRDRCDSDWGTATSLVPGILLGCKLGKNRTLYSHSFLHLNLVWGSSDLCPELQNLIIEFRVLNLEL